MKAHTLYLLNHKYYGVLITILTNMAGLAFLWTSLSAWYMSESQLFGFQTQIMTWILGTVSNLVLALVLYATSANKLSILTIVVWFIAMFNMTIVVFFR